MARVNFVRIEAPFPLLRDTLILPSPDLGNSVQLAATVQTQRSMSGLIYTYVKSKGKRKAHLFDFLVSKHKAQEVREFFRLHTASVMRYTDHNEVQIVGYVTINPLELRAEGAAGGWPGGEAYSFSIQIEEKI